MCLAKQKETNRSAETSVPKRHRSQAEHLPCVDASQTNPDRKGNQDRAEEEHDLRLINRRGDITATWGKKEL